MKKDMRTSQTSLRLTEEKYIAQGHSIAARKQTTVAFPMHFHSYFELEIVLDGSATQILNGKSYEIARGDVYLITPTDYHRVVSHGAPLTLWNVVFDGHAFGDAHRHVMINGLRPQRISEVHLQCIDRLCEVLSEECKEEGARCDGTLLEGLLSMIIRDCPQGQPTSASERSNEMEKACHYLQMHFREAPTLSEIAAHVGFHPAYFSEQFKKHVGVRYIDRLNELRIGYAKRLLSQGLRVSEACFGAGFGSLSNFQHCFKQLTGDSPRAYKQKCK